jgi:hypothetical protein
MKSFALISISMEKSITPCVGSEEEKFELTSSLLEEAILKRIHRYIWSGSTGIHRADPQVHMERIHRYIWTGSTGISVADPRVHLERIHRYRIHRYIWS